MGKASTFGTLPRNITNPLTQKWVEPQFGDGSSGTTVSLQSQQHVYHSTTILNISTMEVKVQNTPMTDAMYYESIQTSEGFDTPRGTKQPGREHAQTMRTPD